MTAAQAGEVVAILLGAFPALTLEAEGVKVWADLIAELDHYDTAEDVALRFARHSETWPTIAAFRSAYFEERRRVDEKRARERGLPEPGPQGVPEDVREWMATHQIGRPL